MTSKKRKSSRKRSYTKNQIIVHPLTRGIFSILQYKQEINKKRKISKKTEMIITEIYNELKKNKDLMKHYPNKIETNGATKKGLNRNTVLDHLNAMNEHNLVEKRLGKNNISFWKPSNEIPLTPFIALDDIKLIENLSESINPFEEHGIHLYGFQNAILSKKQEERNNKSILEGVKKIKEGMNILQYAESERLWFHRFSLYKLIMRFNLPKVKIPILDRRIFAILIFFAQAGYTFVDRSDPGLLIEVLLNRKPLPVNIPWFQFENDTLIIKNPNPRLISILKSNFKEYSQKTDEEMKTMLKDYQLSSILTFLFSEATFKLNVYERIFPIVAVVHSDSVSREIVKGLTLNDMIEACKDLKINTTKIEKDYFSDFEDEPNGECIDLNDISHISLQVENMKNTKCSNCGGKIKPKKIEINEFLQKNMEWLS